MTRFWDSLLPLDRERTVWVAPEELGEEKIIRLPGRRYKVKIPPQIRKERTILLQGLGRKRDNKTGNLLLHVRLNKGDDVRGRLWISETAATQGAERILAWDDRRIRMVVPSGSYDGLTIRLKGLGREFPFQWGAPLLRRRRGDLLVKLVVYPDEIAPRYGAFGALSTDNMALEGWVYRKFDELQRKMGESSFAVKPVRADAVANLFNQGGWLRIGHVLIRHLGLGHLKIDFAESDSIARPGECQRWSVAREGRASVSYIITINEQFIDNPFTVAAILAHELCHVVYYERIADPETIGQITWPPKPSTEVERTVDLLVFMFKLGEFQLRVARDSRLTLGYFNQDVFERMQVIVARKLGPV